MQGSTATAAQPTCCTAVPEKYRAAYIIFFVVLFGSFVLAAISFPVAVATTNGNPRSSPLFIIGILGIATFAGCVVLQTVIQCAVRARMQREFDKSGGHVVATNALTAGSPTAAPPAPAYYAAGAAPTVPQYGTTASAPQYYGAPSSVPVAPPGYGAGAGAAYPPPGAPPVYEANSQATCYGPPPPLMGMPKAV
eukprot:m51a1_g12615 hypothetical protein (194) ;mRNA; f:823-1569